MEDEGDKETTTPPLPSLPCPTLRRTLDAPAPPLAEVLCIGSGPRRGKARDA